MCNVIERGTACNSCVALACRSHREGMQCRYPAVLCNCGNLVSHVELRGIGVWGVRSLGCHSMSRLSVFGAAFLLSGSLWAMCSPCTVFCALATCMISVIAVALLLTTRLVRFRQCREKRCVVIHAIPCAPVSVLVLPSERTVPQPPYKVCFKCYLSRLLQVALGCVSWCTLVGESYSCDPRQMTGSAVG